MRTLVFALVCIGIGFGIAKYRVNSYTANIQNVLGITKDMDKVIQETQENLQQPGRIEVIGGTDYNFGTMKRGSRRSHSFTFKNVGGKPVEIEFKSSTCKCTVGKLENSVLDPGKETSVDLEWYAEKGVTEFAQTATIASNVVGQEEIKLTVQGRIGTSYVFTPPTLDFGDIISTEEKTITGRMYSFEETPIDVAVGGWADSTLARYFDVRIVSIQTIEQGSVPDFADARQSMDFEITMHKGVPPGRFNGEIVFRGVSTKESQQGYASCAASGRSISTISIIGGRDFDEATTVLSLGDVESRTGTKKSVFLKVRNVDNKPAELKVRKVTPDLVDSVVKVSIGEPKVSETQSLFPITFEIPPGSKAMEVNGAFGKDFGKIVFETNVETASEYPMFIKFKITE